MAVVQATIYMIPFHVNDVGVLDPTTGKFSTIPTGLGLTNTMRKKYNDAVVVENKIYMILQWHPKALPKPSPE